MREKDSIKISVDPNQTNGVGLTVSLLPLMQPGGMAANRDTCLQISESKLPLCFHSSRDRVELVGSLGCNNKEFDELVKERNFKYGRGTELSKQIYCYTFQISLG